MRKRLVAITVIAGLAMVTACTLPRGAVRGFESQSSIVAQRSVSAAVTEGMPAGSSSYVGASVDGSLIGFLGSDAVIRWYRVR